MKLNYNKLLKRTGLFSFGILFSYTLTAQTPIPKNIIVLIGDGMGYNCIEAANYYSEGKSDVQPYEKFPVKTWHSSFNTKNSKKTDTSKPGDYDLEYRSDKAWSDFEWVRRRYTDSAPAATALSTGVKTFDESINIDVNGRHLTTIAQHALSIGKKAGVVTSVPISHATPAGFIAHNTNRNNYADIAKEMLLDTKLSVIMGTGHPKYNSSGIYDAGRNDYKYVGSEAIWQDLLAGKTELDGTSPQDIDGDGLADKWTLIQDSIDFAQIANGETEVPKRLLGIPKVSSTLQANRSGGKDKVLEAPYTKNIPPLALMAKAALNVLDNENGFFVMIEGGAIDLANHANAAGRMIEEMMDFNATIKEVITWIEANGGWEENLVIITADHECGYILGPDTQDRTVNNPVDNPVVNNGKGKMPGLSYNSGNHTNMLCPVFAKGAGAELLKLHENRTDFYRGKYIDNTDIGRTLFSLWTPGEEQIKNFILMVSSGWGYNQILATNYYEGKTQQYEAFPIHVSMSTYAGRTGNDQTENRLELYGTSYNSNRAWSEFEYVKSGYTHSAPASSAMATGVKTYDNAINYNLDNNRLETLPELATAKGKSAGIVTTVPPSHATSAGLGGAHNPDKNNYQKIAQEMFFDSKLAVIIGTGHPEYDNQGNPTFMPDYNWISASTFKALRDEEVICDDDILKDITGDYIPDIWTFVEDSVTFASLAQGKNIPVRLAGMPKVYETLQAYRNNPQIGESGNLYKQVKFDADATPRNKAISPLHELSLAALNVLNLNDEGFYLMIEGGATDWCNHANQLGLMIEEQRDFNIAVDSVIAWVERNSSWDETLLVITGNQECGYLLGPDTKENTDNNPDTNPIIDNGIGKIPGHSYNSGEHTNQLIPLYAKGACADKFNGYLNNYDYVRGYYMDNTDLANLLLSSLGKLPDKRPDITIPVTKAEQTKVENKDRLIVYPTIVKDFITVECSNTATLTVTDANGKVVFQSQIENGTQDINLKKLEKGLYIISTGEKQTKIVKI